MARAHLSTVTWGEDEDGYPFLMGKFGTSPDDSLSRAHRWADGHLVNPEEARITYVGSIEA